MLEITKSEGSLTVHQDTINETPMSKNHLNLSIKQEVGKSVILLDDCEIYATNSIDSDDIHKVFDAIMYAMTVTLNSQLNSLPDHKSVTPNE
jgi:hypothetical protein